ncbi:MAG: hypothetical protein SFV15_15270 [Polyangiaceae bacterium]|nr:hypothetical protein [Polyangiaceae bacterium]
MRSFSVLEWALGVSVGGSVLAVVLPTFLKNVHASRVNEPVESLNRIAQRATALAAGRSIESAYPESVPLTPAKVPRGEAVVDPPGTWDHPTWRRLNFGFSVPHSYSFSFESQSPQVSGDGAAAQAPRDYATFVARAFGDLDGDGALSTFEISGESRQGQTPLIRPLVVHREVE